MDTTFENYKQFVRPDVSDLLKAVGLDVVYHKAAGNKIYYRNTNGDEIEVSDFLGGYGAGLFGHNHPVLVEHLISSLQENRVFLGQASIRKGAAELAKSLSQQIQNFTGKEYTSVFGNSGAEAVEAAIKHAVLAYRIRANTSLEKFLQAGRNIPEEENFTADLPDKLIPFMDKGKKNVKAVREAINQYNQEALYDAPTFLALKHAFHGKTNGALNLTYHALFRETTDDLHFSTVFIDSIQDLMQQIEKHIKLLYCLKSNSGKLSLEPVPFTTISALFVEPIQGEGGINVLPKDVAQLIQEVCRNHEVAIIADEIQCGMGRTGTFLFSEQINLDADCYLLSKSLGGGLCKISAAIFTKKYFAPHFSMIHTSTFAEDDLSCSVALRAVDLICKDENVLQRISRSGKLLKQNLTLLADEYPDVIEEVRGECLMLGVVFKERLVTKSNTIKFMEHYNLLGYAIAGFLLKEYSIRVAPTLSQTRTLRIEPSYLVSRDERIRLLSALRKVCEILRHDNIAQLLAHLVGRKGREIPVKNYYDGFNPIVEPASPITTKVAFIGHFIEPSDIALWDPALSVFDESESAELVKRIYPVAAPLVYNRITVKSLTGDTTQISMIGLAMASKQIYDAMVNRDITFIRNIIEQAVDMAREEGCSVVGLGGYSSIVTRNGKDVDGKGISVTTGNSYTVAAGLQAIQNAAQENNIQLSSKVAAVVGASGNIGSVFAELLADQVRQVWLISRKNKESSLFSLAGKMLRSKIKNNSFQYNLDIDLKSIQNFSDAELYHVCSKSLGIASPVQVRDDLGVLQYADIIVSATNQPNSVIFPKMLKKDFVILADISVPADADMSVLTECPQVRIIKGGIISAPLNRDFYIPGIPLKQGELFACMTETILLGLEKHTTHFSFGAISKKQVLHVWEIARKHGFLLSRIKSKRSY